MTTIKQLIVLRRKAGLTRKEFFDYHYQEHGKISTGPDPAENPTAYFQTHFFDAAYHSDTTGKVPNAHPSWAFSDDVTELYFDSSEHMERSFKSQWVREKVGPDGVNFSDFSAVMPMFVKEEKLPIPMLDASEEKSSEENEYVAMYFVSLKDDLIQPEQLASLFAACLQQYASGEVRKLIVNTPTKVDFDLGAYFKGNSVVNFGLVFTVTLQGAQSVESVRKAQKKFESESGGSLDLPNSWIGFGERAVVLDQRTGIKFDASRQPLKRI